MIKEFWNDRRGTTNIVSLLIVIGIAIVLAVLFFDYLPLGIIWNKLLSFL